MGQLSVYVGIVPVGVEFVEPTMPAKLASCVLTAGEGSTMGHDCFDPVGDAAKFRRDGEDHRFRANGSWFLPRTFLDLRHVSRSLLDRLVL
jgi:hypothetical protein